MTTENELERFYKSFSGKGALPLDPNDPYYVSLWAKNPDDDPILELYRQIRLAVSESVHLLTGFRGNGKSTQLRRLKKMLEDSGCAVFLVDMLDYVFMTKPIAISDFILSLMAALAVAVEKMKKPTDSDLSPPSPNYWERFVNALESKIELKEINLKLPAVDLGLQLKTDEIFKAKVQKHFEGRHTQIIDEAHKFVVDLVREIRQQRQNPDCKVVLLVDSMEQLHGIDEDFWHLYRSVVELFSGQAASFSFPQLHVVYTVPPYLPVLSPNPGRALGGSGVTQWPNIHVRKRDGEEDEDGLTIMQCIVEKRFPAWNDFISPDFVREFARYSGGDIRDFFRLLRDAAIRLMIKRDHDAAADLDEEMVKRVIQRLRNDVAPIIAKKDALWLAEIHKSKEAELPEIEALPNLVRFFDGNLIMNYLNSKPWYDIHPLLVEKIERMT